MVLDNENAIREANKAEQNNPLGLLGVYLGTGGRDSYLNTMFNDTKSNQGTTVVPRKYYRR